MSLVEHAEKEMRLAGLYEKDSDYGGMIPEAVMALVKAHSGQGHSGGSHWLVMQIFNKVINFETLTPLTTDPAEWMDVCDKDTHTGKPVYQNRRNPSWFCSNPKDKSTWYDVNEKGKGADETHQS